MNANTMTTATMISSLLAANSTHGGHHGPTYRQQNRHIDDFASLQGSQVTSQPYRQQPNRANTAESLQDASGILVPRGKVSHVLGILDSAENVVSTTRNGRSIASSTTEGRKIDVPISTTAVVPFSGDATNISSASAGEPRPQTVITSTLGSIHSSSLSTGQGVEYHQQESLLATDSKNKPETKHYLLTIEPTPIGPTGVQRSQLVPQVPITETNWSRHDMQTSKLIAAILHPLSHSGAEVNSNDRKWDDENLRVKQECQSPRRTEQSADCHYGYARTLLPQPDPHSTMISSRSLPSCFQQSNGERNPKDTNSGVFSSSPFLLSENRASFLDGGSDSKDYKKDFFYPNAETNPTTMLRTGVSFGNQCSFASSSNTATSSVMASSKMAASVVGIRDSFDVAADPSFDCTSTNFLTFPSNERQLLERPQLHGHHGGQARSQETKTGKSKPHHKARERDDDVIDAADGADEEDEHKQRFRQYQSDQWRERFEELRQFHQRYGHCLVPHNFVNNFQLAQWVKRQRYQYKLKHKMGRHSTLTDEREVLLQGIGFCWDSHHASWMEHYQALIEYRKVHGHCNVPSPSSHRRKRKRKYDDATGNGNFMDDSGNKPSWKKRCYRKRNSSCNNDNVNNTKNQTHSNDESDDGGGDDCCDIDFVDSRSTTGDDKNKNDRDHRGASGLAIWVKCQRRQYKLFISGDRRSTMTPERFARLEAAGFDWDPRNLSK